MQSILLSNGVEMPVMAIGTNWMGYKELYSVMRAGFEAGFRAIDTARDYGNEDVVGSALRDVLNDLGLPRSEIFITTKIGNSQQIEGNISEQIDMSLKNLHTDYVDLWLMHWPYPNYFEATWHKMVEVYRKSEKVKAIGVANFRRRHFEQLFASNPCILPMVNQMEYHPLRSAEEDVKLMRHNNIKIQAYAPLCRLIEPLSNSLLLKTLSIKYKKTVGQIILRWHIQQGDDMPIFKTYKTTRFKENIDIFDFSLTEEEMDQITLLNMDYKYHLESSSCPGY